MLSSSSRLAFGFPGVVLFLTAAVIPSGYSKDVPSMKGAIELTRSSDAVRQRLGWSSVAAQLRELPSNAEIAENEATEIESASIKAGSDESIEALFEVYRAAPSLRTKRAKENIHLEGAGDAKDFAGATHIIALLASGPSNRAKGKLDFGFPDASGQLISVVNILSGKNEDELSAEGRKWVATALRERTGPSNPKVSPANHFSLVSILSLALATDPALAKSIFPSNPSAWVSESLSACALESPQNPVGLALRRRCNAALQAVREKEEASAMSMQSLIDLVKNEAWDGKAFVEGAKHLQLVSEIKKGGVLKAEGIEIDFGKRAATDFDPNLFFYQGSSIEIGKYVGMTFTEKVDSEKSPYLPMATIQRFTYSWWAYLEPGGTGKFTLLMKMGLQPAKETNWVITQFPYLFDNFLKNARITCESGCLTKAPVAQEFDSRWFVFTRIPNSAMELRAELDVDVPPRPHNSRDESLSTRWKRLPLPGNALVTWVSEFDSNMVDRFPPFPPNDIGLPAPPIPPTGGVPQTYGLLSYLASLQRTLLPKNGHLSQLDEQRVAESAARALVRLHLMAEPVRNKENLFAGAVETVAAPFERRRAALQKSLPVLVSRTVDNFAPKLEADVVLTTAHLNSINRIYGQLKEGVGALRRLSMEEKWQLLGRSAKTLKIDNPETIADQAQLTAAIFGAAEQLSTIALDLQTKRALGCEMVRRFSFTGRAPLPSYSFSEAVREMCGDL